MPHRQLQPTPQRRIPPQRHQGGSVEVPSGPMPRATEFGASWCHLVTPRGLATTPAPPAAPPRDPAGTTTSTCRSTQVEASTPRAGPGTGTRRTPAVAAEHGHRPSSSDRRRGPSSGRTTWRYGPPACWPGPSSSRRWWPATSGRSSSTGLSFTTADLGRVLSRVGGATRTPRPRMRCPAPDGPHGGGSARHGPVGVL